MVGWVFMLIDCSFQFQLKERRYCPQCGTPEIRGHIVVNTGDFLVQGLWEWTVLQSNVLVSHAKMELAISVPVGWSNPIVMDMGSESRRSLE